MPSKKQPTFGSRVRARMDALKLTQSQLAERAGLSPQYVNNVVTRGTNDNPSLRTIRAFAAALDTTAEDLIDGVDLPT